jgi:CO/xanthine dehydrogenase FAD-binding subunit
LEEKRRRKGIMRLPKFDYITPQTIEEACSLLALHKDKARVMAGGTDLLPKMKSREVAPQYVIGLSAIPGLDYIEYDRRRGLRIGALATLAAVMNSPVVRERFSLLAEAVSQMASVQVRNRGTVAGNLCNAVPSADTTPSLIVMGAKARLVTLGKERVVAVEDFFVSPDVTILGKGELMTEIQVPEPPPGSGGAYLKFTPRRAMDLAIVGVAALVTLAGGTCKDAKIALGAVAPTPIRAKKAEDILRGKALNDKTIKEAAETAMKEARPISDIRASEEYRRKIVGVLTQRAIKQAWERAKTR